MHSSLRRRPPVSGSTCLVSGRLHHRSDVYQRLGKVLPWRRHMGEESRSEAQHSSLCKWIAFGSNLQGLEHSRSGLAQSPSDLGMLQTCCKLSTPQHTKCPTRDCP